MKAKRRHRALKIILITFGVLAVAAVGAIIWTEPGRKELLNMTIADVDFSHLRDGVYEGEYKGRSDSMRDAAVEVTVSSGKVTNIRVTGGALSGDKQNTAIRDGETISDLFDEVIQKQSLKVDVISGATITSNAHLKAVEDALEQAAAE